MSKTGSLDSDAHPPEPSTSTAGIGTGIPAPDGQIGPYHLLQVLGEGGFATVYLAQQHEPVRRQVALKIIKAGMDSQALIARFEAEQQALALLHHPGVAQVFDAGTTAAGRPYFVMEYVKGIPITEHCDRHKLSLEDRLELFLQVCDAVQYAHQKGIIHRDLKPSNLLVSLEGQQALPKVIDFGIAKALGQPLTERTLHTELGQLMGTPEYMSPEQAEMTSQDIDTRSDIYSLGVVLYELLAGTLPLESETLRAAGPDHVRKVIREQDPKTPSTRLTGFTREQLAGVAQCRRVDPGVLGRRLRGDLDWITLKALDKDRTRRYGSVGELMADIGRHLHCEPVLAGPPSTLYRLKKLVRRNKALVTGLAAVLAVLVAGIITTSWFAVRAERQGQTSQAVADFLTHDLLGLVDPNKAKGPEVSVRYILDGASKNLQGKFRNEPLVEASIRQTLGDTYVKLGESKLALPHFERVLEIRRKHLGAKDPALLAAMTRVAQVYAFQSRYEEANRLLVQTLEIKRRVLGDDDPSTLASLCLLACVYSAQGRRSDAQALLAQALEIQERLGGGREEPVSALMMAIAFQDARQGRHEEAQALAAQAWETCRRALGPEHEATLHAMSSLGMLYQLQGRYDQAVDWLAPALDTSRRVFGETHSLTLGLTERLAIAYLGQGRYAEAEPLLLQQQQAMSRTLGNEHRRTAGSVRILVNLYEAWGRPQEAQKWRAKLPRMVPAPINGTVTEPSHEPNSPPPQ